MANRLVRRAAPLGPNQVWLTDITYLPTRAGGVYLAGVMDLYSHRIVGWALDEVMLTALVTRAL